MISKNVKEIKRLIMHVRTLKYKCKKIPFVRKLIFMSLRQILTS